MLEKRYQASSVVLFNETTLWITGPLRSTEFVLLEQNPVQGPNLPFSICGHSMIQLPGKTYSCGTKTLIKSNLASPLIVSFIRL